MDTETENLQQDYATYVDYVNNIHSLQNDASSTVGQLYAMNKQIIKDKKLPGHINNRLADFGSFIGEYKKQAVIVGFIIPLVVLLFVFHIFSMVSPIISAVIAGIVLYSTMVTTKFLNLEDGQKTQEYKELENNFIQDGSDIENLKNEYDKFSKDSTISGFIQPADVIETPTMDDPDNFGTIFVSEQLETMMGYIDKKIASNLNQAYRLYTEERNGQAMVENTARTAEAVQNYGVSAAQSATVAHVAASSAVGSATVAAGAAGSAINSANRAGNAANRANGSANAAASSARNAQASANSAASSAGNAQASANAAAAARSRAESMEHR